MFVSLKKYRALVSDAATLSDKINQLEAKLTTAHHELNEARRHRDHYRQECHQQRVDLSRASTLLTLAQMRNAAPQFTEAQLRTLLQLCHPDKHGGKESAVLMTQHINKLRKS